MWEELHTKSALSMGSRTGILLVKYFSFETYVYVHFLPRWKKDLIKAILLYCDASRFRCCCPENAIKICLIDETNLQCEECGTQRLFPWTNFISFIFEHVMIVSILSATLLQTLIINRWFIWFEFFGLTRQDPSDKFC